MPKQRLILSGICRALALAFAVAALTPLVGERGALLLPASSPYLMAISSIGLRAFSLTAILAIPMLLMAIWRGRWFCRFACPTGLCLDMAGGLGKRCRIASSHPRRLRLGTPLLLLALGSAAVGFPFFLWLDPLVLFNGFAGVWTAPFSWQAASLGFGFSLLLLLSLRLPGQWCQGLCPLGATQQWLGNVGRRLRTRRPTGGRTVPAKESGLHTTRRAALTIMAGGATGLFFRNALARTPLIRPPGSVDASRFNALCTRCGNCIRICPEKILAPAGMDAGVDGLLTPVIRMQPGYCSEFCNRCTTVCPSGAITMLTPEQKREVVIGTAVVTRQKCLAWAEGQYCMVCDEFCPFNAIHTEVHNGVNCPVVNTEACRGCGLCQKECPALQTAIIVEPIHS